MNKGEAMIRQALRAVTWVVVLTTAMTSLAQGTDAGKLAIREARNGEISFSGPIDHFSHRFTIIAQTTDAATVLDVKVPDFTDGAGQQLPTRWSWIGGPPKAIDLYTPAEILVEAPLPAPATYSTSIEVVYSFKDATGKESTSPLRVPLRVERTAAGPPALGTELPVTAAAGDTVEVTMLSGPATASVALMLRVTGATPVTIDKATPLTAPRKGAGGQLVKNDAIVTVKRGLPVEVPRDEVRKVELEVGGLDGPGTYEGKVLLASSQTGATKEISFTLLVKRSWWIALALIALGVLVSWRTRAWLQRGRVLALARRDLGRLRDALVRIVAGDIGDTERNAAGAITRRVNELLRDLEDARQAAELDTTVARVWKRVTLLQSVVDARRLVALLPPDKRGGPSLALETIASTLGRDLDDAAQKAQEDALQALDLEKTLRSAIIDLATTLRDRLNARSEAHPACSGCWEEVRGYLAAADEALKHDRVFEARSSLMTGYRVFTKQLGKLLRELAAEPPPKVEATDWQIVPGELERILEKLDQSGDVEQAIELHARAVMRFLRAAAPALAAAARDEAQELSLAKAEFEELAKRADALLAQPTPDADDVYREIRAQHVRLVHTTPRPRKPPDMGTGIHETGAAPAAPAAPAAFAALERMIQPPVDARLSALRRLLPSTETLAARIKASNRAADIVLFVLAALTGLQILWIGNATWGTEGDLLAAFLWGAGVHSVGQQLARGALGLDSDFLKTE